MRVLVCGSRDWQDAAAIKRELDRLQPALIVSGGAPGADTLAAEYARAAHIELLEIPAKWKRFGRAAGPLRNAEMLRAGQPELVLAFHEDLPASRGTKDMVARAERAGIPVKLFKN